ncbi:MAG: tRNA pseudouridine(55) synthase TruB [Isosphaeraceae bacterium]
MRSIDPGLLVVDKPRGITSRAAVDRVVRLVGRGTRVGHAGTLDPLASGVLVVLIGAATRLVEEVQRMPKTYRTVVRLGARSDTLDADGRIEPVPEPRRPEPAEIAGAVAPLVGEVDQVPPEFSALKVGGRRAYDLARAGQSVELAPRRVRIDRIEVVRYDWPELELEIDCGTGTYIRSIARDVGEALGCGGLVDMLIRTRIGPFRIEDAVDPSRLTVESFPGLLRPPIEAVAGLRRRVLEAGEVDAVASGCRFPVCGAVETGGPVALVDPRGRLVALGEVEGSGGWIQPRKVLLAAEARPAVRREGEPPTGPNSGASTSVEDMPPLPASLPPAGPAE